MTQNIYYTITHKEGLIEGHNSYVLDYKFSLLYVEGKWVHQ